MASSSVHFSSMPVVPFNQLLQLTLPLHHELIAPMCTSKTALELTPFTKPLALHFHSTVSSYFFMDNWLLLTSSHTQSVSYACLLLQEANQGLAVPIVASKKAAVKHLPLHPLVLLDWNLTVVLHALSDSSFEQIAASFSCSIFLFQALVVIVLIFMLKHPQPTTVNPILNSTAIRDIPIEVTPHATLNSSQGVIVERDLKNVPESEIFAGLSTRGVSAVRCISTRKDGVTLPTNTLFLTFTSSRAPATIKTGYLICRVQPYIQNPLRCLQFQRFGYSKTSCRGSLTHACCGGKDPNAYECDMDPHCINCNGSHPSYFHSCPKWLEEKEV
ncbi:uncharacterized protein LOC143223852 [Tachypleus tridentatus]|uniref:uncharacterized protein LOC143223852 n=1 Tax=Tachypleus tridentatus TaxID=6853 RepID=UPI003FD1AEAC